MSKRGDMWMPLYIGDYLADTQRLSTEGHGAYLLLLMDYWRNGAPPDDDEQLAAIAKLPLPRWKRMRAILLPFFQVEDGRWHQKRADEEMQRAGKVSAERSAASKARWEKNRSKQATKPAATGDAIASAKEHPNPIQTASPSPSPSDKTVHKNERAASPPVAGDLLDIPLMLVRPEDGDWSKPLFRQGLSWLAGRAGKAPNTLRSFVGKCLQAAGNDHKRVFDLIARAQTEAIAEPQAWILANLGGNGAVRSGDQPDFAEIDRAINANLKAAGYA